MCLCLKKIKDLETHLLLTRAKLDRIFESKLDDILNSQKSSSDKTGLGFDKSNNTSYALTTGSRFVPQTVKIADPAIKESKVEKQVKVVPKSKLLVTSTPKKRETPKNPHFCHHCGASRHTHPNCFKVIEHRCPHFLLKVDIVVHIFF